MKNSLQKILFTASFLSVGLVQGATLAVDPATTYQKVEGFGGAMVWYQSWVTQNPNKAAIYDTLFRGLGLSILRQGNWVDNGMNSDVSTDSEVVAEALKRNPGIRILTSSWSPPAALKANGSMNGPDYSNTLALNNGKFVYDQFGGWWKQSIQRLAQAGIHPTWISVQNEPDMNPSYQSCLFSPSENTAASTVALADAGFETGTTGWNFRPNKVTDATFDTTHSDSHSGSAAGRVVVTNAYGWSGNYLIQLQLPLWNVQPNSRYLVSFWAKGSGTLQVAGWNNTTSAWMSGFSDSMTSTAWQHIQGIFQTGSKDSGTAVSVNLYLGELAQTWLFDDFQVSYVPSAGMGPAVAAVHDSLATLAANLQPQVLAPEVLGLAGNNLENYTSKMDPSKVSALAFHIYSGGSFLNPTSFLPTFDSVSSHLKTLPMFMTEYYNQEGQDTTKDFWRLAWIMQEGFTRANLSMWVYWDMAWDHGSMVSLYNPSTAYPDTAPLGFRIQRTYYAQAQYSRFVKPTWLRVSASAGDTALKVVAFASKAGDSLALVIVNPYGTAVSTTPSITKTVTSAQVWTTDATHSLANTGNWVTGQALSVPAHSVITIAMTLPASTGILNRAAEGTNASNPNGYMIYDLLGRPYMHVQTLPAQLPQGRWIVVPR